jgi:hypothetical protein
MVENRPSVWETIGKMSILTLFMLPLCSVPMIQPSKSPSITMTLPSKLQPMIDIKNGIGVLVRQTGMQKRVATGHRPLGGESLEDVASRAKLSLTMLLTKYGKELDEHPKEFLDKNEINSPNDLPQDIPHTVLVSHRVFLAKLYYSMVGWNTDYPRMITCDYSNVDW